MDSTFRTSREIAAPNEKVFAAFSDPKRLAKWWGPAGFSNTFHVCEFKTGGKWSYTMHGPDGRDYNNECHFEEVTPNQKVVVRHDSKPKYRLTIELSVANSGTTVRWTQTFDKPEVAKAIAHIVAPANEQNLDRLSAEVLVS